MNEVNIRYSMPSKYDVAKFGEICKVIGDNDSYEIFIQLSENSCSDWKPVSYLFEKTFEPFINNPDFISLCLCLFSENGDKHEHYKKLSSLISK